MSPFRPTTFCACELLELQLVLQCCFELVEGGEAEAADQQLGGGLGVVFVDSVAAGRTLGTVGSASACQA